jgi:hypothetical protein
MVCAIRGVVRIKFQLEFGELLEVDGVLFVPGLRVNLLSMSALGDVGYATLFNGGHVFIYREGADSVEPQLIGDRVDRLYVVRGQPTVGDESNEEQEAPETAVGLLTAYSARGQLMCHEVYITRCEYVEDSIGSTWAFDAPALNFVNEISAPLRGLIM